MAGLGPESSTHSDSAERFIPASLFLKSHLSKLNITGQFSNPYTTLAQEQSLDTFSFLCRVWFLAPSLLLRLPFLLLPIQCWLADYNVQSTPGPDSLVWAPQGFTGSHTYMSRHIWGMHMSKSIYMQKHVHNDIVIDSKACTGTIHICLSKHTQYTYAQGMHMHQHMLAQASGTHVQLGTYIYINTHGHIVHSTVLCRVQHPLDKVSLAHQKSAFPLGGCCLVQLWMRLIGRDEGVGQGSVGAGRCDRKSVRNGEHTTRKWSCKKEETSQVGDLEGEEATAQSYSYLPGRAPHSWACMGFLGTWALVLDTLVTLLPRMGYRRKL